MELDTRRVILSKHARSRWSVRSESSTVILVPNCFPFRYDEILDLSKGHLGINRLFVEMFADFRRGSLVCEKGTLDCISLESVSQYPDLGLGDIPDWYGGFPLLSIDKGAVRWVTRMPRTTRPHQLWKGQKRSWKIGSLFKTGGRSNDEEDPYVRK